MQKPDFWKTRVDEMHEILSTVKRGRVSTLAASLSGNEIPMVVYGEKHDFDRKANYNSACGAKDPIHYADKKDHSNVVLIAGGIHANEFEGISSALNFIQILETGHDFMGRRFDFADDLNGCRIIIVPIMNVDGRLRQPVDTFLGVAPDLAQRYSMGMWKDGRDFIWPYCKQVHPIPMTEFAHVGGYFNDQGVNFMHDNFYGDMQPETRALLKLADEEAPDFVLLLHSGGDMPSTPLAVSYVPMYINEKLIELSHRVKTRADQQGLRCGVDVIPDVRFQYPTHSLNLTSALHHVSGCVPTTYESESVVREDMYEKILRVHFLLFEEAMKLGRVTW